MLTLFNSVLKFKRALKIALILTICGVSVAVAFPSTSSANLPECSLLFSNGSLVPSEDAANNFEGYTWIYTVEDLQAIPAGTSRKYVLANDIDASATKHWNDGQGFVPIGGVFQGTFEGQGYVIRGLHINKTSEENYTGLFEVIGGPGIVRNVGFENASVSGHRQTGILAGVSRGDVAGVYATGQVTGTGYVGGIFGQIGATTSLLQEACADVAVTGASSHVGGLVGENRGTIRMAYSVGDVRSDGNSIGLGGFVGTNQSSGSIYQSFSTGSVTGGGHNVGGFVGNNKGSVRESYSRGGVAVSGPTTRQGGLVGENDGGTVISSYWDIVTSGQTGSAAGTGIFPEDFRSQTFWGNETDWDMDFDGTGDKTWRLYEGDSAPLLLRFSNSKEAEDGLAPDGADDLGPPSEPGELRPTRGEIVPRMLSPNLLRNGDFDHGLIGWSLIEEEEGSGKLDVVNSEHGPALQIMKYTDRPIRLVSDRIPVNPGHRYQITGLYHTDSAKFGNMAEFTIVEVIDEYQPESADIPAWRPSVSASNTNRALLNSRPGDWRRKTRQFAVSSRTTHVRLVLTVVGPPVTLLVDNLYFSLPNEAPRFWSTPPGELPTRIAEARQMLTEGRQKLIARPDSSAVVETVDAVPRLFIDGQPSVPQVHMGDVFNPARAYFRQFGEYNVDIHIVQLRQIWSGYREYDLSKVDQVLQDAILREPEGYYIVKIDLMPYVSWHEDFPDDAAQDRDGVYATSRHDRFAPPDYWSDEYREQAYHLIQTVVDHIHNQLYGKAVIGYFIAGGEDDQFYWQVDDGQTIQDGNAPGSLPLFQRWIRDRYPTVEALRTAWNDPSLTYENVRPPVKNQKYPGSFLDPQQHRDVVDFMTYLNEELARFLLESARIVKETAPKDVIVGAYYGRGASAGVYPMFGQTQVMLKSDMIDFMGAQPGYSESRAAGNVGVVNWVYDSVRANGKIMMLELDFRTWIRGFESLDSDFRVGRFWNLEDLTGAAARDIGKMGTMMGGVWWMEMTGGWFYDDAIMKMIGRLHDVGQELYEEQPIISPAEIVFVADEESLFWTPEQVNIRQGRDRHSLGLQLDAMSRAGIKYDFYYMDDLIHKEMDQYKIYVFLNLYYVDDAKREFIDNLLKRDGKILLWQYAPGYVTPERLSIESMEQLTGMSLRSDDGGWGIRFVETVDVQCSNNKVSQETAKLAELLLHKVEGRTAGLGLVPPGQRFYVQDPSVYPLARYDDGRIGAAVKKTDSYTSIYMGHPSGFTPQFIANLADLAGIHRYMEPGEMFMHNRNDFIVIHGVEGGDRVLRLPFEAKVTDLLGERILAESAKEIPFTIEPGETIWFKIE